MLLSACQDGATVSAAAQLAADGKAASDALAAYLSATADTLVTNCDLDNFHQTLILRSTRQAVATVQAYLPQCMQDTSRVQMIRKLRTWANDARSVSGVYASLGGLTGAGNVTDSQKSVDDFLSDLQTATHDTLSPEVQPALDLLTRKAVEHRQARAIKDFAQEMAAVPRALRSIVEGGSNPAALDEVYAQHDKLLGDAVKDAYLMQAADPTPDLSAFYGKLNVQMPDGLGTDPYFAAFAITLRVHDAGPSAQQLRAAAANLLRQVEDETQGLLAIGTQRPSLRDSITDVRHAVDDLYGILHPAPAAGASSGGNGS